MIRDDLAVRDVVLRLALLADEGDLDEYGRQYTRDASWQLQETQLQGRAAIVGAGEARRRQGAAGPGSATRHLVQPLSVEWRTADEAVVTSYWQFWVECDHEPRVARMGRYIDVVIREADGAWRVTSRVATTP